MYCVETWDAELSQFTPQIGVPHGPYKLFELRKAIRKLKDQGYSVDRHDFNILIYKLELI